MGTVLSISNTIDYNLASGVCDDGMLGNLTSQNPFTSFGFLNASIEGVSISRGQVKKDYSAVYDTSIPWLTDK